MIFRRLYYDRLAQASYLIACEATRRAIVIDPLRDPTACLEAAAFEDVRIELVTETHVHADFLSGAETLSRSTPSCTSRAKAAPTKPRHVSDALAHTRSETAMCCRSAECGSRFDILQGTRPST
ncbi:MAG: hypothetical protein DMD35_13030 [Gemmatimonadetes bacterium]|nr:MAG: hypothetical protein DMD35_13030 [Gemmatimonadota bacterium]